jgi:putative molybdopterin biosynthesis protein
LGIHAAAAAYDLDFFALTKERYDLVLQEAIWETSPAQALIRVLRSARFKEAVVALGGYDTSATGRETWIP